MQTKKQARWQRVIRKVINLFKRYDWTRHAFFRDKNGIVIDNSENAVQFCILGAFKKLNKGFTNEGFKAKCKIRNLIKPNDLIYYNDYHCKSKEEMINTLQKVIDNG